MDNNSSFPKPRKSGLSEENHMSVHSQVSQRILVLWARTVRSISSPQQQKNSFTF